MQLHIRQLRAQGWLAFDLDYVTLIFNLDKLEELYADGTNSQRSYNKLQVKLRLSPRSVA